VAVCGMFSSFHIPYIAQVAVCDMFSSFHIPYIYI